ncbi:MAG: family 43 glycosylhydrolase [Bacteroidales bacterium]
MNCSINLSNFIRFLTRAAVVYMPLSIFAQNPIVPPGVYITDPSARIWNDGNIYIYGSVDESTKYYCSHRYHVLSSDAMMNWKLHENTFSSKGEDDQVPYSDNLLYAPDCMERDGKYYLYYCLASNQNTEGVAVSDGEELLDLDWFQFE